MTRDSHRANDAAGCYAQTTVEKLAFAQALAIRRLACGVVPELDACFAALELERSAS